MKKYCFLLIAVLLNFALGCTPSEKKDGVPPPPKAPQESAAVPNAAQPESAREIINNYATGLENSMDKARLAQARTDLGAIQDAIRNFQVENGRYPASLDAIKSYLRAGTDLSLFNYDSNTGTVSIK